MEGSETVKLKVKSPSSAIADIELEVGLSTSVFQLKGLIREKYPGSGYPAPSAQKLLYAGKLLSDKETLQEFLRFDDDCQVYSLHLACATPVTNSTSINNVIPIVTSREEENTGSVEEGQVTADTLAWQWQQMMAGMYQGGNIVGDWGVGASGYNMVNLGPTEIQQMALVQQMYTQYLSEYMQYTTGGVRETINTPPAENQGNVQDGGQQGRNRGQVMNAGQGGGQIDEDEEPGLAGGNRDLLDWLYVMSRLVVLASIVYFYSSFTRFMVVAGVVGLLYLYQAGYFGRRERVDMIRGEVDRIRVRGVREEMNNIVVGEAAEEHNDDSGDDATLEHDPQNLQIQPDLETEEAPLNHLALVRNFVTVFFSSLIPDNNQVV